MSTSNLHENTDSIDDKHNSVRAATDNIVYVIFNVLSWFGVNLLDIYTNYKEIYVSVSVAYF